jgi:hypothetical protein
MLEYSTYLGGSGNENSFRGDIAVDAAGNAYVAGETASPDFPTLSPVQGLHGGSEDAFLTKLNPAGSGLVYSTYLGGSKPGPGSPAGRELAWAVAVDSGGNAYLTGDTQSSDFPLARPLQRRFGGGAEAFVAKVGEAPPTSDRGRLVVSPGVVRFGRVRVGRVKRRVVRLINVGRRPVTGTVSGLGAPFRILSDPDPFVVEQGRSHRVVIEVEPEMAGRFEGTLTVTSDDRLRPSVTIQVSGKAR